MKKTVGFIGLGRMGKNMVYNLLDHKWKVVAYNRHAQPVKDVARKGAQASSSVQDLVSKLQKPRVVWIMIKAGKPVDGVIHELTKHLSRGDVIVDGGNSWFKDSQRRHQKLKKKGIHYLDCGTSGGMEGARKGACMMVGGEKKAFKHAENLFKDMCTKDGYGYMGESGAGHFVKMVHNGIEYGMMGAINEGFLAIEKQQKKFKTDMKEVCKVYAHGSIIESRLMSWLWDSFQEHNYLKNISCEVPKGETENEMKKLEKLASMKVLHEARMMRARSRKHKVCSKLIAAMRNRFGGHKVNKK
jgi:6-phosphogluconate dehydrogenase